MTIEARVPGRITITTRTFEKLAAAIVADALGVPARDARASVRDERGAISADIATGVATGSDDVLGAAERAREHARTRLAELTGARVADVRLRLTHLIDQRKRTS